MFAYCNNNPVVYYDNAGNLPQAVEDAIIHNKVLKEICRQNSDLSRRQTCIYYNGNDFKGGWGFCDLYNVSTGEVWELKKDSTSWSCTTAAAKAQLRGYTRGRLKHYPDLELHEPYKTNIAGGHCTMRMNGYNYSIDYWNEGGGILRYSYVKEKTDARKTAEAVVAVVALTAAVVYCAPAAVPAYVSAASFALMY